MIVPRAEPDRSPPQGAGEAVSALDRHRPALLRYVRVLGADAVTAEDLVQEALVVALERGGFDASSPAGVFAFLRAAARNRWLHHARRRVTRREVEHADEVWDRHCEDDGDDYLLALRRCVEALPEQSRRLLAATYGDGLGRADVGRAFGKSEHGIKSALRRLRAHLHDCIERRRRSGA
ncbi:MAG: sigma-70 family RNA polymerase sigma factor [Planctomycetes bacterium]|nr:sigma-70 family RNA polymerase sigma factor [Planctomycetota bacterium]